MWNTSKFDVAVWCFIQKLNLKYFKILWSHVWFTLTACRGLQVWGSPDNILNCKWDPETFIGLPTTKEFIVIVSSVK